MQKSPMFGKGMVWAWIALCVGFASGHILARADRVQSRVLLERMRSEFEALKVETKAAAAAQIEVAALKQELAAVRAAATAAAAVTTEPEKTTPQPVDSESVAPEVPAAPEAPADPAPADPTASPASPSAGTGGGGRRPAVGGVFSRTGRWIVVRGGRSSILAASRSSDVSVPG
jgi:hypothetical protein